MQQSVVKNKNNGNCVLKNENDWELWWKSINFVNKTTVKMEVSEKYIRFDWAVKRMLRDKANFAVLEGLITVLLGEEVRISEILESEGNQERIDGKFNRVDVKAKNSKGEIIIVEVQLSRQLYYLQRILYGVSKAITEHIVKGEQYDNVKKVYSINIIYFDIGQGSDYLYHGVTEFKGVHTGDRLIVNMKEADEIKMCAPEKVFPEYYIIRVNEFNSVARTPIEEWLDYLKNNRISDDTTTPGLREARERLLYMTMSESERRAYDAHLDRLMQDNDILATSRLEGRIEGLKEGRDEKAREIARNMLAAGMDYATIERLTGLSADELR